MGTTDTKPGFSAKTAIPLRSTDKRRGFTASTAKKISPSAREAAKAPDSGGFMSMLEGIFGGGDPSALMAGGTTSGASIPRETPSSIAKGANAALAGGVDVATLGYAPEIYGGVNSLLGIGGSAEDVRKNMNAAMEASPGGALLGEVLGFAIPATAETKLAGMAMKASPAIKSVLGNVLGRSALAMGSGAGQNALLASNRDQPVATAAMLGAGGGLLGQLGAEAVGGLVRPKTVAGSIERAGDIASEIPRAAQPGATADDLMSALTGYGDNAVIGDIPQMQALTGGTMASPYIEQSPAIANVMLGRMGRAAGQGPGDDLISGLTRQADATLGDLGNTSTNPLLTNPTKMPSAPRTPFEFTSDVRAAKKALVDPKFDAALKKVQMYKVKPISDAVDTAIRPDGFATSSEEADRIVSEITRRLAVKEVKPAGAAKGVRGAITNQALHDIVTSMRKNVASWAGDAFSVNGRATNSFDYLLKKAAAAIEDSSLNGSPMYREANAAVRTQYANESAHKLGYDAFSKRNNADALSAIPATLNASGEDVRASFFEGLAASARSKLDTEALRKAVSSGNTPAMVKAFTDSPALTKLLKVVAPEKSMSDLVDAAKAAYKQMDVAKSASDMATSVASEMGLRTIKRRSQFDVGTLLATAFNTLFPNRLTSFANTSAAATSGAIQRQLAERMTPTETQMFSDLLATPAAGAKDLLEQVLSGDLSKFAPKLTAGQTVLDTLTNPSGPVRMGGASTYGAAATLPLNPQERRQ